MYETFSKVGKLLLVSLTMASFTAKANNTNGLTDDKNAPSFFSNTAPVLTHIADSIYDAISLGDYGLEKQVFATAYRGFEYLQKKGNLTKTNLLTIVDYSQSSNNKRLYVIDILNSRLLFNTYVSHGRNSGGEFAETFSNSDNSNKSSLGFMVTGSTYSGKAGYSLHLDGMEPGINSNVRRRAIVLHGSHFVNEDVMSARGIIGRSLGCPAVPYGIHVRIIDAIKGGSCLFINHPDETYARTSAILNTNFDINAAEQMNTALQAAAKEAVAQITSQLVPTR